MGMEGSDAGWDGDMEFVEVFVVAMPREDLAIGGEDDSGDLVDGAGGAMVAGNPLGCGERDGAGVDGDVDFSLIELAWGFGEVRGDLDGGFLSLQGRCGEQESHGQEGVAVDHERGIFLAMAAMMAGASGRTAGEKRAATLPWRSMRNFSKFQRMPGSGLVTSPLCLLLRKLLRFSRKLSRVGPMGLGCAAMRDL